MLGDVNKGQAGRARGDGDGDGAKKPAELVGGLPREHVQADFDIIAPRDAVDAAVLDAETIKCAVEALVERLPPIHI